MVFLHSSTPFLPVGTVFHRTGRQLFHASQRHSRSSMRTSCCSCSLTSTLVMLFICSSTTLQTVLFPMERSSIHITGHRVSSSPSSYAASLHFISLPSSLLSLARFSLRERFITALIGHYIYSLHASCYSAAHPFFAVPRTPFSHACISPRATLVLSPIFPDRRVLSCRNDLRGRVTIQHACCRSST